MRRLLRQNIFQALGGTSRRSFVNSPRLQHGDRRQLRSPRYVLLDAGRNIPRHKVSITFRQRYSHTHSIVDQRDVTDALTRLDDGVRITYHATVLAGVHVAEQAMVGAMAVATKDVRPYHVYVGIPAKSVRVKPNAPADMDKLTTVKPR